VLLHGILALRMEVQPLPAKVRVCQHCIPALLLPHGRHALQWENPVWEIQMWHNYTTVMCGYIWRQFALSGCFLATSVLM